jgi:hypothetical protein
MTKEVLALLVVVACGKPGGGNDWSAKPLNPVSGTAHGVAFKIQLPDGLQPDKLGTSELGPAWEAASGDRFSSPSITVLFESIPAKTPDELAAEMTDGGKAEVARKEAVTGGLAVTVQSAKHGMVRARVLKFVGDKALECTASQANNDGLPSFDATKSWLEKICMSLTVN